MYTIIATQSAGSATGSSFFATASTEVEVVDGHVIPEFGTIAAMILVVAIVAIIAVSAKTKLSLVPKY
jgi:predicted secreted protein with PEFG-CTERM motif